MIVIGVCQFRSKVPVGFYTCEKAPEEEELTDVTSWNRKNGMLWMGYGTAMVLSFLAAGLLGDEMIASIVVCVVILGGIPVMMLYHHYLKKKYSG